MSLCIPSILIKNYLLNVIKNSFEPFKVFNAMRIKRKKGSFFLLFALHYSLFAQVPTSCPSNSLFSLSGSAKAVNQYIQLTPDASLVSGQVWSKQTATLTKDFNVKFRAFFGAKDGANGIAFIFRSPNSSAMGGSQGGLMGYSDIGISFAVEFDTNKDFFTRVIEDDQSTEKVDMDVYPNSTAFIRSSDSGLDGLISGNKDLGNIEDNAWHSCEIDWKSSTKLIVVKVDGKVVNQLTRDIVNADLGGNSSVIFGFTASTREGNLRNEQSVCVESASYTACNAGDVAPVLSKNTLANVCPNAKVSLEGVVSSTCSTGSILEWHTGAVVSAYNKVPDPTNVGSVGINRTYYPVCFDGLNNCYGKVNTTGVTVKLTMCSNCRVGNSFPNLVEFEKTNVCPSTTVSLNGVVFTTCPSGTALEWHTTAEGLGIANKVTTPGAVGAGVYIPVCYDAANDCFGMTGPALTVTIKSCGRCNSGSTAPVLSATTRTNVCPSTTVTLNGLVTSTCPTGSALEWHTVRTGFTANTKVANSTSVSSGVYYPTCFDAVNSCYSPSPTTGVTVTITNCVTCNSGSTAPVLSSTTRTNVCPSTTVSLNGLVTSTCPTGSALEWHTVGTGFTANTKVANSASVSSGVYYPTCFDAVNSCYSPSPTTGVTVTITNCVTCNSGSTAPVLSSTTRTNVCPSTTVSLNGLVTSTCPTGSALEWHTVRTGFTANTKVANSASVSTGVYYPTCFDAVNSCYSPSPTTGVTVTITNCVTCNSGSTAPVLSSTTRTNVCPSTTVSLNGLVTSTCPTGSALEWHTVRTGLGAANKISTPTQVKAGTYYPVCFDSKNNCFGPVPTTGVTVTITNCVTCNSGSTAPVLSATTRTNVCPSTTVSLNGLVTSTCPTGSALEWHRVRTSLNSNTRLLNTTSVGAGTYYPVCFDATNGCYSPTPVTGVTVSVVSCTPCKAGANAPILAKQSVSNTCPKTTVSLNGLVISTCPTGSVLEWHSTKLGLGISTKVNTPESVGAGVYYPVCFDMISNCYSATPDQGVVAKIYNCPTSLGGLRVAVSDDLEKASRVLDSEKVRVYPNPSADKFVVDLDGENGDAQITVESINGKLVQAYQERVTNGMLEINLLNQEVGMYRLKILINEKVLGKKILVNR